MKWVVPIGILFCGVVLVSASYDQAREPRHLVWCIFTIIALLSAKDFRVGKLHLFAVGYLGLVLASGIWAINKAEWMYWSSRALLVVSFLTLEIDKKRLAKVMIALGVIFFIYFWFELPYMCWVDKIGNKNMFVDPFNACRGLMRQNNHWAAALFFIIPFCIYAIKEKFWVKAAWVIMVLTIVDILLLSSKTGYCALAAGLFVVLVMWNKWFVLSIVPVLAGCFIFRDQLIANDSVYLRLIQWKPTLEMIWANPFGVGAGNWMIHFPNYARSLDYPGAYTTLMFRFPHNDYLWICAEMGILGLMCFLGMVCCAIKKQTYLLVGLFGYMAIACFSAPRERPFASIMLCVFLSLGCVRTKTVKLKWLVVPLLLVLVIMGFRLRANIYNKRLRRADNMYGVMAETKGLSVFSTLTEIGAPYHWWRGIAEINTDRKQAYADFKTAYKYNPYNVQVLNGVGIAYMGEGNNEEAKKYFELALEICPKYKLARKNLRRAGYGKEEQ